MVNTKLIVYYEYLKNTLDIDVHLTNRKAKENPAFNLGKPSEYAKAYTYLMDKQTQFIKKNKKQVNGYNRLERIKDS